MIRQITADMAEERHFDGQGTGSGTLMGKQDDDQIDPSEGACGTSTSAADRIDDQVLAATSGDQKPVRKRRLHWHLGVWSLVLVVLLAVFLAFLTMSLTGRVWVLPDWASQKIESRVNAGTDAVQVSLSRVEFGLSRKGIPQLRFRDLALRDETGLEIARLNTVDGRVLPGPLLSGQIRPASLSLSGAQVTIRRRADGSFDLSFGQGVGPSGDLPSVIDKMDAVFVDGTLSQTRSIEAEALTITLEDARSGRIWQVTDGQLSVTQDEDAVDVSLSFDVFNQTEELAETTLSLRSSKTSSEARLSARFENALSTDVAVQSPLLSFLELVNAPISGALETSLDESGAVSDLTGELAFGAGSLWPDPAAKPVKFTGGRASIDYDPERERMDFAELSVTSDWGQIDASGHAYLRGWAGGWPSELIGQIILSNARISPPDVFEAPVELDEGGADFRLNLSPFRADFGQFFLTQNGAQAHGSARIDIAEDGWDVAVDLSADELTPAQVLALWPVAKSPRSRKWVAENIQKGKFANTYAAWRRTGSAPATSAITAAFEGVTARLVKGMVPLENAWGKFSILDRRLVVEADRGVIRPLDREGRVAGVLNAAGSRFVIPKLARPPKDPEAARPPVPADTQLSLKGPVRAALYLLDRPPFKAFRSASSGSIGPDMADGTLDLAGRLDLALQPKMARDAVRYDLQGALTGLTSEKIVPGRALSLPKAALTVTNDQIRIEGSGSLSGIPVSGTWLQAMKNGAPVQKSKLSGGITLNQTFMDAFKIALPKGSVTGEARAQYEIQLTKGESPRMVLNAPLQGVGLKIAPLGWSKAASSKGSLSLSGKLGAQPDIESISLSAPGLEAKGRISLSSDGGLDTASFSRVKVGGWLDAPVTLTGRGAGQNVAVSVTGGRVDMRKATLGSGGGTGASGTTPITLQLNKLVISEGITLTGFTGGFTRSAAGLQGDFSAKVNGGPKIAGTATPQSNGTAFQISSRNAGAVLRKARVFKSAHRGKMDLQLTPGGAQGVYDGDLKISNVNAQNAPAMAELLSAISVVGLLQQLRGNGIPFNRVEAKFKLDPERVTIYEGSAIGHSMGISVDGYYFMGSGEMKMQGVISPFYIVNSAGRALARKGEGLIGFNYTLDGTADNPRVGVNPLSLFTPGIFRDIFRRSPPPKPTGD